MELENGSYLKKMVYMRTYHGKRLDALADEIRLTYARFPNIVKIVFDHNGLGDALPEFLAQPWIHPDTAKELPPWVLDAEHSIIHNAQPILRSVKATAQVNQQLASCLRIALEQRALEMPVNSRTIQNGQQYMEDEETEDVKPRPLTSQEKAIYLETDALQIEMGNIVMKNTSSGTVLYETARTNQHKDRYSALAMAVRFVAELEEARKRRLYAYSAHMCVGVVSKF